MSPGRRTAARVVPHEPLPARRRYTDVGDAVALCRRGMGVVRIAEHPDRDWLRTNKSPSTAGTPTAIEPRRCSPGTGCRSVAELHVGCLRTNHARRGRTPPRQSAGAVCPRGDRMSPGSPCATANGCARPLVRRGRGRRTRRSPARRSRSPALAVGSGRQRGIGTDTFPTVAKKGAYLETIARGVQRGDRIADGPVVRLHV